MFVYGHSQLCRQGVVPMPFEPLFHSGANLPPVLVTASIRHLWSKVEHSAADLYG